MSEDIKSLVLTKQIILKRFYTKLDPWKHASIDCTIQTLKNEGKRNTLILIQLLQE